MDIKEILPGLKRGKLYQLPDWWRFYVFLKDDHIWLKSPYTEEQEYSLHINELESTEWTEVTEEELKNRKG